MKLLTLASGQLALQGDLDMDSVAQARQALQAALQGGSLRLDLSGLGKVDSAALALLLDAARQQQAQGGQLHVDNAPDSVRVLAQLYELAPLLGLDRTNTP